MPGRRAPLAGSPGLSAEEYPLSLLLSRVLSRIPARSALMLSAALCVVAACPAHGQQTAKPLTVAAIFGHGSFIGSQPDQLTWSPDGKHLTYIDSDELIDMDPTTGKSHVLVSRAKMAMLNEQKGTEQELDHRSRYDMASYIWAPDSAHLLFDASGHLWLYDLHTGTGVQMGYAGEVAGGNPKFSPNGKFISFIRNHDLAVIRLHELGTPTTVLESSTSPDMLNGEVDWVYLEELETRSNYFWSPDSKNLAFLQTNETQVPEYPIEDWLPTHATVKMQRYPQPGDPNPEVRIGVIGAAGGKTVWMKVPTAPGQDYIPRFGWAGPKTLWIETLTRDQKHRDLYFADTATGLTHLALEINDFKFLDDNYNVSVDHGSIVLTNWTDGHNHLYLYSYDAANPMASGAKLLRKLTDGAFEVGDVYKVDFEKQLVEYASNEGNPLGQQLWQVSFDGKREPLTTSSGFHAGNFSPVSAAYVDKQSTRMDPPTLRICARENASAPASQCNVFWSTRALAAYHLRAPEQLEVKAHDGTTLYATLLLPEGNPSPASVPLIVNPYGGPGPQTVANRWGSDLLFDELLAQHGFAVLHADNRGTGMRGRDFAQAAYHDFGPVQLEDQLTVVDAVLDRYPQLDAKRLGWWGWSWGGSFTLYAMTHSDRFRAGVAVAPVTDWRDYDSIYTERYMSQPSEFPEGYKDFSVVNSAAQLKGRLLICHGTGDDNVHIENSVQFIQKLIQAQQPYDFQIFPRKTHSISGSDVRTHLYSSILAHFEQYLMPPAQ